jgi:A/G-specific adenine glycosylase
MRQIPGVGPYTAAAVASIAFNDPAAAVDGNVIRVLSRLRALRGNPGKMVKTWDRLAAELLHPERPGCHNQVCLTYVISLSGKIYVKTTFRET